MILHVEYSNIKKRVVDGFTKRYNVDKLVYYEVFDDLENARAREIQIKSGNRKRKLELIRSINAQWKDLSLEL